MGQNHTYQEVERLVAHAQDPKHREPCGASLKKLAECSRRAKPSKPPATRPSKTSWPWPRAPERSARNIAPWKPHELQVASQGNLQLVRRDRPHWNNPRCRHLSPKQRIHILRRDGYHCQCPSCPNQLCQQGTTTPDNLTFLDGQGRNLGRQHRLEVAEWLDRFLGWPGSPNDSRRARATRNEFSPFFQKPAR